MPGSETLERDRMSRPLLLPNIPPGLGSVRLHRPRTRPARAVAATTERAGAASTAGVFGLTFVVFAALGLWLTLDRHLVVFDAVSRVAHADLVWHDDPAKLSAIGFTWPPLQTLVLLPLAVFHPLDRSLAILPLSSALAAASTLAVLWRTLALLGFRPAGRAGLLALLALNPMSVYYATNGMSEMLAVALVALAAHGVAGWARTGSPAGLLLAGLAVALATLARYELALCAVIIAAGVFAAHRQGRRRGVETEATLIALLLPLVFALATWCVLNWLIMGDALNWLTKAGGQSSGRLLPDGSIGTRAWRLLEVTGGVWLLVPLAALALAVVAWRRRSPAAWTLCLLTLSNALTTMLLMTRRDGGAVFEARYNMRAVPFALVGAAYVATQLHGRGRRAWLVLVAVLGLASIPAGVQLMRVNHDQYAEEAFVQAIQGHDVEGYLTKDDMRVGVAGERRMADYIDAHVSRPHSILTDDALSAGVILLADERRFVNRIQHGDVRWRALLDRPRRHVDYLLVTTPEGCRPRLRVCHDLVRARWPGLLDGTIPWARVVYDSGTQALVRLLPRSPLFR